MVSSCSLYHPKHRQMDSYLKVTAYYYRQWENFHMPFHTHEAAEVMYVISGQCQVATESGTYALGVGEFIVLDGGFPHRLIVNPDHPCRMMNLEFILEPSQRATPSLRRLAEEQSVAQWLFQARPAWTLRDPGDVYHTLKSLVMELDAGPEETMLRDTLLTQLVIQIARLANKSVNDSLHQTDVYVQNAIAYVHHHYDCHVHVDDVAEAVNLHPAYLHRIFKRATGQTIGQYLTSLRIEKAKILLSRTDIPITEIGDSIGVNSSQYFSTLFKKHTGVSPQDYRSAIES